MHIYLKSPINFK